MIQNKKKEYWTFSNDKMSNLGGIWFIPIENNILFGFIIFPHSFDILLQASANSKLT